MLQNWRRAFVERAARCITVKINPHDFYRYLPVSAYDEDWGLYVTGAGRQTLGRGAVRDHHPNGYEYTWEQGRIFVDEFAFLLVCEGAPYELETEVTGLHTVAVGDAFLLFPRVWHRYRCTASVRHAHLWTTFAGCQAAHLLLRKIVDPAEPILHVGLHPSVLEPFRRLIGFLEANPRGLQQKLASCLLEALSAALAIHRTEPGAEEFQDVVRRAIVHLEQHVESDVDLETLARDLHVSYDQFRHVFKERTGLPPYQYHLQLRISRAQELLINSTRSIKQVAYRLGFTDPYHFSKMFKKKTGLSPQAWRAQATRSSRAASVERNSK